MWTNHHGGGEVEGTAGGMAQQPVSTLGSSTTSPVSCVSTALWLASLAIPLASSHTYLVSLSPLGIQALTQSLAARALRAGVTNSFCGMCVNGAWWQLATCE